MEIENILKLYNPDEIIMFHELNSSILDFMIENVNFFSNKLFTFDDGLYSQYYYFETLQKIFPKNIMIFFISTDIICPESDTQSHSFPKCDIAHKYYFKNNKNKKHYMKLSQIKELSLNSNVIIGGHGHKHLSGKFPKNQLLEYVKTWTNDFINMVNWFAINDLPLSIYCTPYNEYSFLLHGSIKNKYPIKIIGPGRIDIQDIIKGKV